MVELTYSFCLLMWRKSRTHWHPTSLRNISVTYVMEMISGVVALYKHTSDFHPIPDWSLPMLTFLTLGVSGMLLIPLNAIFIKTFNGLIPPSRYRRIERLSLCLSVLLGTAAVGDCIWDSVFTYRFLYSETPPVSPETHVGGVRTLYKVLFISQVVHLSAILVAMSVYSHSLKRPSSSRTSIVGAHKRPLKLTILPCVTVSYALSATLWACAPYLEQWGQNIEAASNLVSNQLEVLSVCWLIYPSKSNLSPEKSSRSVSQV
ncbi:hypothetical protein KIPB_000599 [Kipferlia bialata]|uniref:Uncharacterized protein n=1 Tax=Kipferlia bialata TaxID=797122 RepID=A0A9K3CQT0_9EUKA|nr:hypothetical protein KIPB_000599 [Kipferlia bialata]|eukprot:g599.t1